jgi:hypothetical protein
MDDYETDPGWDDEALGPPGADNVADPAVRPEGEKETVVEDEAVGVN